RGHHRHRHAQHAAGQPGVPAVRVLPGRAGHAGGDRRVGPHRADVQRAEGPADLRLRQRPVLMTTVDDDRPRTLARNLAPGDRIFRGGARLIGVLVLVVFGAIGFFLAWQSVPTLRRYGWHFFVENEWQPERDLVGLSATLLGTIVVAIVALVVAFPLAWASALYISEYSPARLKKGLVAMVDLMAAVPS